MKSPWRVAYSNLLAALALWILTAGIGHAAQLTVVNMIPNDRSGETNQDSEPNLAVNPADPNQIAGSAFTPSQGFCGPNLAPIYVSTNGGNTWALNCIVPSDAAGTGTGDITVRFSSTTNNLYAGILRRPGDFRLNILRTNNFTGAAAMTVLVDRNNVDQPYMQATTVSGNDRIYVGNFVQGVPSGRGATIDQSLDANAATPTFDSIRIDRRATNLGNFPPIRPAIASDSTVYAAYYGLPTGGNSDVVVVRDDKGGAGANPFTSLIDPGDGSAGRRVVTGRKVPAFIVPPNFGQERLVASNLTIAVDPNNSARVCVGWADRVGAEVQTLHVRCSTNRGVTWSPADLQTITNATNPALAINTNGTIGFLYQQVTGIGANQRWVTHVELTDDAFATFQDLVLANVPASTPAIQFFPYIGDYVHLMTVGATFYGIFSANNTPDNANFPNGVIYQRNANFATNTLLNTDNVTSVAVSIDPFFFSVVELPTITRFTGKAHGVGLGARGGIGIVGMFTFDGDLDLSKPGATVTITDLFNEVGGAEVVAPLPQTLFADPRNNANVGIFKTPVGTLPIAKVTIGAKGGGRFTLRVDVAKATIVPPSLCPTTNLTTSFTIDDGVSPPVVVATLQPWLCFGAGNKYLKSPPP